MMEYMRYFSILYFIIFTSEVLSVPGEVARKICSEYSQHLNQKCPKKFLPIAGEEVVVHNNDFPHVAKISISTVNYPVCLGALISKDFILTIDHCYHYYEDAKRKNSTITVRLGDTRHYSPVNYIQDREISEGYLSKSNSPYNLGLLKLSKPVEITPYVKPACINICKENLPNDLFKISIAREKPDYHLMKARAKVLPKDKCLERSKILMDLKDPVAVAKEPNCIEQKEPSCTHTYGSHVIYKGRNCMIHIISFILNDILCIRLRYPLYTINIADFTEWIENTVWPK